MASSSSSSSYRPMKHQVFLSFRGEDTRYNFTSHLLKALEEKGLCVFFDEDTLEKGEQLSQALSLAIAASKLSIIVLSKDYVSSRSCLAELADIMDSKHTQGQIVLPIFYHVDPSDVRHIGGRFKTSFEEHEKLKGLDQVHDWKKAFAQVGQLKGWHIEGGKFDRPETVYIKDIVEYVIQKFMKHEVFLSFRGIDTRLNFTSHLFEALKDTGMKVFFDEDGEEYSPALSRAIAESNTSIIVLSKDYASSKSCLAELSEIMSRKETQGLIVLPIFYHVDPSDVRNIGGSFKTSFEEHEAIRSVDEVKQWKSALVEVGRLKGWHIEGGKFDRSETEYIKEIVEYAIKKLNGVKDQKKTILRQINKEGTRVIGLWGMGGIGKTTLADAVYSELSPQFADRCFLQNVSEKINKKGRESLRNELLSQLLNQKEIHIDTPTIGSPYRERLNNKKVIVVLDDVRDGDEIDFMGVRHFGHGSKIILTSRDRQLLKNGGADKIYEVKKLNEKDSLQLFSTFAFKQLNPPADFRDLSNKFVMYAQGSPLALRVFASQLYRKSREDWECEMEKLNEYGQPEISMILRRIFDGLDELEKNIFLDIAIFFKEEPMEVVKAILCSRYNEGAACGISNLLDKCLLEIIIARPYFGEEPCECISMHDMLEEMGKHIVRQESKRWEKRSRLWSPDGVCQVLRDNNGIESIEGIKLDMSPMDELKLRPTVLENMLNLKYIYFYFPSLIGKYWNKKLHADGVDILSLPNELRYLCWEYFPFKSLSSSFNPKNLVVLKLPFGEMEQLWDEDDHQVLVNLREIDLSGCKNLRKISNLFGAFKLKRLTCRGCESLVELPCLNHLKSLERLDVEGCVKLRKIPDLSRAINLKFIDGKGCKSLVELTCLNHLAFQEFHDLEKFPEIANNFSSLHLEEIGTEETEIEETPDSIEHHAKLEKLDFSHSKVKMLRIDHCESLTLLSKLPPYLQYLNAHGCKSLEKVSFKDQNINQLDSLVDDDDDTFLMLFSNCFSLNLDSIDSIESNALLKIGSLAEKWARKYAYGPKKLVCCFPCDAISANKFEYQSESSSLILKMAPNCCSGSRLLVLSICLVVDLTNYHKFKGQCICEYKLTTTGGGGHEKFESKWSIDPEFESEDGYMDDRRCIGDHVLILFSDHMVKKDKNYEEASFEFYFDGCETEDYIKVKKCGVHVSYVDEESNPNPQHKRQRHT